MTTKTNRTSRQTRSIKSKINTFLIHTEAHHVMTGTMSRNSHFRTRLQGIGTNYTQHCLIQPVSSQLQFTCLQEELAAYSVERNYLHHIYCRKNSNVPQVAPRTSREEPYLHCHLSYTIFFLFIHCRVPWTCFPRKRGVKEMPVQSDSIIYCINYTKTPEGTKFTHIYLV